jgi:CheY-like chemotaxis protein
MSIHFKQRTILLADDDTDDAEMFMSVLSDIDPQIKCYHVENGRDVLTYLKRGERERPDVIFLDINMPEMSGWECLTKLKEESTTKLIPVLIYSTSSHARDREIANELGATGFITKPSDYKTLKKILSSIANNLNSEHLVIPTNFTQ